MLVSIVSIILTGCASVTYEDIVFDDFVWPAPVTDIDYGLSNNSSLVQAQWWAGQDNSLLILRQEISAWNTLEDVIESNRNTLSTSYQDISFSDEGASNILCDNTDSYYWIFSVDAENEWQDALYFVQYLYIYEESVYLISNALTDNTSSNRILQSMDTIDCPA